MISRRSIKPEVSFINLIDVMLVLLIIFMMAAPTIQRWVDVNLPAAEVSKAKITEGIIVSITKDGAVYIDREKTTLKEFSGKFAPVWENHTGEPVFIRADGEVPYQHVMDVIGETKKIGAENVGLVVDNKK